MAISKESKRLGHGVAAPHAAAFVRVLASGLAEPEAVSAAYQQALREWATGRTDAALLQAAHDDGAVAQERPSIDGEATPERELIALHRIYMFDNHTDQQEEA